MRTDLVEAAAGFGDGFLRVCIDAVVATVQSVEFRWKARIVARLGEYGLLRPLGLVGKLRVHRGEGFIGTLDFVLLEQFANAG